MWSRNISNNLYRYVWDGRAHVSGNGSTAAAIAAALDLLAAVAVAVVAVAVAADVFESTCGLVCGDLLSAALLGGRGGDTLPEAAVEEVEAVAAAVAVAARVLSAGVLTSLCPLPAGTTTRDAASA